MPAPPPSLLPYLAQLLRPSPLHPDPPPSAEAYLRMLIRALCSAGDPDPDEALRLLDRLRLRLRGYRPNGPDLAAVLRALCSFGHSVEAYRRLLLHLRHAPSPSPFLSTPTASSSRCATGPPPDAVSYTTLLNGYARLGDADVARHLLDEMPSAGVALAPNSLTRTVLIKALLRGRRLEETRQLMLRLWPAMEHQQRWPYDANGLLHPRGFGLACHIFGGVKPWVRGKSGLVILMMYASTGQDDGLGFFEFLQVAASRGPRCFPRMGSQ